MDVPNSKLFVYILAVFLFNFIGAVPLDGSTQKKQPVTPPTPTLENLYEHTKTGYHFLYSIGDGTVREEFGDYLNEDGSPKPMTVNGIYRYLIDGVSYDALYKSDENGYRVKFTTSTNPVEPLILKNTLYSLIGG